VTGLRDRGLDPEHGLLFVIDGGKALAAAVRAVVGAKALVQRCRRHKERNVLDHLPEAERPLVQRRLRSAWATPDAEQAHHELETLARGLARQRPGAAASLREGLAETLTVNRLDVGGKLLQTLESTNPVESMIEIVRDHAGRVKRWSSGEMALRWAAAGMPAAEAQFRRVKGYQELPALGRRAPTRRRRTRPHRSRCHRLTVGSAMEAPTQNPTTDGTTSPDPVGPAARWLPLGRGLAWRRLVVDRCSGDLTVERIGRGLSVGRGHQPTAPSTSSRMRSAWPLWRAYSSIMWT
jgi:hypothetical protein